MLTSTLEYLSCPRGCSKGSRAKALKLRAARSIVLDAGLEGGLARREEVVSGSLVCEGCRSEYPILGGVAVLVEDVGDYLLSHVKGIAREVPETEFPKAFRGEMLRARRALSGAEHIEDDLESQRVTALYVLTQYLSARQVEKLSMSAEMRELVKRYWDQGPFARIREGIRKRFSAQSFGRSSEGLSLVELGCGVGGLLPALAGAPGGVGSPRAYLGIDSSFASIALARRLALGIDHRKAKKTPLQVPEDLLFGPVSYDVSYDVPRDVGRELEAARARGLAADFVVGDAIRHPLREGGFDACAALNLIDMLDRPESLPEAQKKLIRPRGWAIQGSPYIWHPQAARALARRNPRARGSAEAVSRLYEERGFSIERDGERDVPWLFFKNSRQLELYSVDLFFAVLH